MTNLNNIFLIYILYIESICYISLIYTHTLPSVHIPSISPLSSTAPLSCIGPFPILASPTLLLSLYYPPLHPYTAPFCLTITVLSNPVSC